MVHKIKVLLASRAMESPPREGGFVVLSDLAEEFANNDLVEPAMFSASSNKDYNIRTERVFSSSGWNRLNRLEFPLGIRLKAHKYNVVHTAHIPTKQNAQIMRQVINKARKSGTKFVQTVTGLPKVEDLDLKPLLWGDHLVCQTPDVYEKIQEASTKPVSLITPWPSPKRISFNKQRYQQTRSKLIGQYKKLVVFPGEFDRLGVGIDFAECLNSFLASEPESILVLACRFDKQKTGEKLAREFPGRVINVGEVENIIELLEAADLVIFPAREIWSKFRPPLVIMEALQLGTPTLISSSIGLDQSVSSLLKVSRAVANWKEFANDMHLMIKQVSPQRQTIDGHFQEAADSYLKIYTGIIKTSSGEDNDK